MSVNSNAGIITYTNYGDGATSDSFVIMDASANPFTVNVAISAAVSPITVSPASLPTPQVGTAYSQTLSATGGTAPYSYVLTSGSLPPGLTLSGATISGTPNQAGSYSSSITVTDNVGTTGTKSYTVTVPNPSSGIAVAAPPTAFLNAPYSQTLSASGALAPYTFALNSGSLPPGISLASNGTLSGTPTSTGTYNFAVVATDSSPNLGGSSPGPYFKVVNLSLTVQNVPPTAGSVSAPPVAYNSTNNPITLNITSAPATSVAIATAAAHGTATASGTSITYTPTSGYAGPDSFTYTATNGAGTSSAATVTITVSPPTITFTPTAPPHPTAGTAYSHSIANASGGTAPYTYTVSTGTLPAGLALSSNGTISGTSTAVGAFTFKVVATDSSTGTGSFSSTPANVTLTVDAPVITPAPSTLPGGSANTAYNQTITATGGTAPYTYAVTAGTLPTGITLSSGGVLGGTPTQAGSFPITVAATDSTTGPGAPYSGSQAYTLTIAGPTITISPANLPNATVGTAYSQTASASGGTAPYTFSTTGSVPPGLSISSSGTLSGTPTTAGDFTFIAVATDAQSFAGSHAYTVHVTAIAPGAPTVSTATAGDTSATVSFTPPVSDGGAPITGYTVTSSPGGFTGSGAGSPITVTGLTNGTAYTFTVTATNSAGTGAASAASNSVTPKGAQTITFSNPGTQSFGTTPTLTAAASSGLTPTFTSSTSGVCTITSGGALIFISAGTCTISADQAGNGTYLAAPTVAQSFTVAAVVPGAPTIGTATAGDTNATVSFTAPASNGGATITGYTVTSSPGGLTGTGAVSPITVTGLTNGTAYTFTVTATNSAGTGAATAASNSVTPKGAQTITFANPGTQNFGTTPTLTAAASSGLTPTFTSSTSGVCTITSGGALTFISAGTCTINADQAGNGTYLAAPAVAQSLAIVVPGGAVAFVTGSPLPNATGGVAYSQTVTAAGGATPYTFAVSAGALPAGLTLDSAGLLSGMPTVAGNFSFTVKVTDAATQTTTRTFTLDVQAPTIALSPSTLPAGTLGSSYTQVLSASGGQGSYAYAVSTGTLPAGLSLSSTGALSGTPTATGSFNFTITATDGFGFTGSQAYVLAIGQPAPIANDDTASTAANGTATIAVTSNDSGGPITSIAIAQPPAHGTATVSGLDVLYTPAANYFGSDIFKYIATGPGGTSAAATASITVIASAIPVATAKNATVLAGQPVTIHAATGASNGPFTAATVVSAPSSGTTTVQGTDIVYTANANASGTFGFDYTLSNAFGTSQPAHVTVTVNPRPVAPALTATATAGTTVQVDLTAAAHGGPFTAANVVSVSPANAGSATIAPTGDGGYTLAFASAATFDGMARITYTLSNAFATSTPGTVDVTVQLRSDPSKNAEVLGVLEAQAEAARRMAIGQIGNFQRRLESLHASGSRAGFTNGITMNSASSRRRTDTLLGMQQQVMGGGGDPFLMAADAPATDRTASSGYTPDGMAFWTGGAMNFGKLQPGTSHDGIDFTTSGLSLGADKQVTQALALGLGVGYGHDASDVGRHGSRSTVDSYNVAAYGSYRPGESAYVDALVGYQWLQFDARRFVTDNGNTVRGSRDGKQWFASFSVGYRHQADDMLLTPYGRLDLARATLDGYTETGDAVFALNYRSQTVKTSTGTVGLLAQWTVKRDYGVWAPQLRAEFGHDMQGSSQATMRYADLPSGPLYQATLARQSRNHTLLGAGIALQTLKGWSLRAEYQNQLDNTSRDNQSILLSVQKTLPP
ncbi:putative Ig domain-containing protein [Rhodanobacter sp. Soil772]|uniref:putative Ig domain-containing protein n=1 Tax=Rhodanobacter sp. Soil772 TaxID=1736406 RepID=UPI001F30ED8C|nr:putative Ig domain-containing protein [Rhodanobacter sp. Soil772]